VEYGDSLYLYRDDWQLGRGGAGVWRRILRGLLLVTIWQPVFGVWRLIKHRRFVLMIYPFNHTIDRDA
jgi:hypothetical protein